MEPEVSSASYVLENLDNSPALMIINSDVGELKKFDMDNEDVISEFIKGELMIFTFNQELIHNGKLTGSFDCNQKNCAFPIVTRKIVHFQLWRVSGA